MNDIFRNFFRLETANLSTTWTKNKILLNSGRNSLRYIIRAYNIKEIEVPYYTCQFIWDVLKQEECIINFYHINKEFMPIKNFNKNKYILYNNYFGICSKQINLLKRNYKNLIIDNCQAFYSKHKGLASFYSLRKFFGVPDGGFTYCNKKINTKLMTSKSYNLCIHLLKAYDKGYNESYINFLKNELEIDKMPLEKISNLTKSLLSNINYNKCKNIRLRNFNILDNILKDTNKLKINLEYDDVPMFYPYLTSNMLLHNKIKNNIFYTECWPQIDKFLSEDELYLKNNIILLPIDQRYNEKDMQKILDIIKS